MNSLGWQLLGTRDWRHPFAISINLLNLLGCGTSGNNAVVSSATSSTSNVQPIQVYSGPELANPNVNVPYTDVTICIPGTSNCQTITDIEVDTGSSGLRLLASEVELTLPAVKDTSGNLLGECLVFADTTYAWGPLVSADIQLASEKAPSVPIQLIGPVGFPQVPAACGATGAADDTIATMGSRGILGLGVFRQDCGSGCTAIAGSNAVPDIYFSCPNTSATSNCTTATVPLEKQVQNPVWLFSKDNNGLIISLPAVPELGAATASGSLIFGIGTREDNALGPAATYTTDDYGYFSTTFNGITYAGVNGSYIDSGTNLLLFPSPSATNLPICADVAQLYCPSITQSYTATNKGFNGTTGQVSFGVANADSLLLTDNTAFSNLGGPIASGFTWGLPFFFGRNVFVGIEAQDTPAGAGPYWAY